MTRYQVQCNYCGVWMDCQRLYRTKKAGLRKLKELSVGRIAETTRLIKIEYSTVKIV